MEEDALMTKIKIGRPLIRETATIDRGRPLVVGLHPTFLAIWAKETREEYRVSWAAIYDLARKLQARGKMR
jgi:hypothetical protein